MKVSVEECFPDVFGIHAGHRSGQVSVLILSVFEGVLFMVAMAAFRYAGVPKAYRSIQGL